MIQEAEGERLRQGWRARPLEESPGAACPDETLIWRALGGEMPAEERRAVVAHTVTCATCAAAWRAAAALAPDRGSLPGERRRPGSRPWLALAAAVALAAVGLSIWWSLAPRSPDDRELRSGAYAAPASELPDHVRLPRERFLLRWTPGPPGTVYDVEVGTEALRSLSHAVALVEPQYQVPSTALEGVPTGSSVIWKVEAQLPSGERLSSVSFFATVE